MNKFNRTTVLKKLCLIFAVFCCTLFLLNSYVQSLQIDWNTPYFEIDYYNITDINTSFNLPKTNYKSERIYNKYHAIYVAEKLISQIKDCGYLLDYYLTSVLHSTKDNVYYFEYASTQNSNLIDGDCIYISIDGKTGEIIKSWFGE